MGIMERNMEATIIYSSVGRRDNGQQDGNYYFKGLYRDDIKV